MEAEKMTPKQFKVFFLCSGNSCRSQMAEGFARHYGGESLVHFKDSYVPF
jgi:protein-tyrosine-phosphatase